MKHYIRNRSIETVGLGAMALILALLGGFLVTAGKIDLTLISLAGLGGLIFLLRPVISLFALLVAALVVVGCVQLYVPELQNIQWGVAGGATLLGSIAVLNFLFAPQSKLVLPPNAGTLFLLVLIICASAIMNIQSLPLFIYGLKGYVQVLGIFFAIAMLRIPARTVDALPKLLGIIAIIQLPFVLQQWLYIVPGRIHLGSGIVAEDVVAGTMGASATGGGSNAVLSILLVTVIGMVAAGFRRGRIRALPTAAVFLICAAPLFLNANRIAALYILVVFAVVFAPTMFKNKIRFVVGATLTAILVVGSVWANLNYGSRSDEFTDWQDLVQTTIQRNTSSEIGYGRLELNRITSITFWWEEQISKGSISTLLLGHGPGAAREATDSALPVTTLANSHYPGIGIGLTGISSLLWELGVVGLAAVFALLTNALRSAHYLTKRLSSNPYRRYIAEGLQAAVIVFAISLFHKNTYVFHLGYQTLIYSVLGILAAWHYQEQRQNKKSTIPRSDPMASNAIQ